MRHNIKVEVKILKMQHKYYHSKILQRNSVAKEAWMANCQETVSILYWINKLKLALLNNILKQT